LPEASHKKNRRATRLRCAGAGLRVKTPRLTRPSLASRRSMFIESASLRRIQPSATSAAASKARALRAAGRDIISLDAGEPDFDTPQNIKDAAIRAIREGKTKYTDVDGIPELKRAVCAKFARENDLSYEPSQINVSPGGKAVLFNALTASLSPGDEVIIPAPYWVSYPDMVLLAVARRYSSRPIRGRLQAQREALETAIGPRTKWLILTRRRTPPERPTTAPSYAPSPTS